VDDAKVIDWICTGSKLTPNHPSLVDEGEETRIFVTAHKRERKKREKKEKKLNRYFYLKIINK